MQGSRSWLSWVDGWVGGLPVWNVQRPHDSQQFAGQRREHLKRRPSIQNL